ncbi:MAG: pseudouridine synthase [Polyangiales bacterium]
MTTPELTCEHSARCGGCVYMGQPMAAQLAKKQASVQQALASYPCLTRIEVEPTHPADPVLGYRTRAKLIVAADGAIGLFERGGHDVVDIPGCRVMHPALFAVVADVRARVRASTAALNGALTGLDARLVRSPGEAPSVLLTLIGHAHAREPLAQLARELAGSVRSVALRLQAKRAVQLLEGDIEPIAGDSVVRDQLLRDGPYHYATFGSFVQAHHGQAAQLAQHVLDELARTLGGLAGRRVLELFAGSGALGFELAKRAAEVTLVERYTPALEHAREAAREQALPGLHAISGDAEQVSRELFARAAAFDAVIVNPPRRGLRPGLRAQLAQLAPQVIVYVSCDPVSLARDLADFAQLGYAGEVLRPFDMIPLSEGVESVLLLRATPPPPVPVLYADDHLLVVDKPPHLPTTPDAAHADSLLTRLQREHALPALTALHRLDVGTSGVCLFAKRRDEVEALAGALRDGEKHYLALVRGAIRPKGTVRATLREQGKTRAATSRYTRVGRAGSHSLVRVRPEQGRTHQVRKHMAAIGHPILGDERYGDDPSNRFFEHRHGLDRTFLHAARIVLPAVGSRGPLTLEAPLAPDLAAVLASLRDPPGSG